MNTLGTIGLRTANAMRKESPTLAKYYDSVTKILAKLDTNEQVAIFAIVKHTIEVDKVAANYFNTCPSLRSLEMM